MTEIYNSPSDFDWSVKRETVLSSRSAIELAKLLLVCNPLSSIDLGSWETRNSLKSKIIPMDFLNIFDDLQLDIVNKLWWEVIKQWPFFQIFVNKDWLECKISWWMHWLFFISVPNNENQKIKWQMWDIEENIKVWVYDGNWNEIVKVWMFEKIRSNWSTWKLNLKPHDSLLQTSKHVEKSIMQLWNFADVQKAKKEGEYVVTLVEENDTDTHNALIQNVKSKY